MLQGWVIVVTSFAYLGLLFAIAYYADKRVDSGRPAIASPYVYSLSLAVYATAWTFYGSVGRAAVDGVGFLPIYIGPTLMIALWWIVMRKILRISKQNRITSLADFVASRYGKSALLGGVVTIIAVIGIVPYISLQLKAISTSFTVLVQYPEIVMPAKIGAAPLLQDTALWMALILALFTIAFGTRHLDAAEHHPGMVAAIAFESLVKLLAFIAVGVFVTWGIYDGFGDVFARAAAVPKIAPLLSPLEGVAGSYASWVWLTILSMLAIMFLPRQFQVTVIENVDESHLKKAIWVFPAYMLLINIFVLPIAFGGRLHFPGGQVDADTFVLTLPMVERQELLALLVFIGGLSAATGMVIVETIALSTMVCNDLLMPVLLRLRRLRLAEKPDLTGLLLGIRRGVIVLVLLLGYLYFRLAGEAYALVSIGLISFAAVAQFAPAVLGGIFWRGATRRGALSGLIAGFLVWLYTLLLPALARSGWLPLSFLDQGPFGIELLKPLALFGLAGLDQITHAMIWSMIANIGLYVGVSLAGTQSAAERRQASVFVDVFRHETGGARFWRGTASARDLFLVLARFIGASAAESAFTEYTRSRGLAWPNDDLVVDAEFVHFVETQLAGAIGSSSARIMIASAVKEEALTLEEVSAILDEASQVVFYSHRLEQKSRELEAASAELRAANERLKELDRLKDDFISTVTHELRTPLTSIRAFSEILLADPNVDLAERVKFLGIITRETERLTRLINQVLDMAKISSGRAEWQMTQVDVREVVADTLAKMSQVFKEKGVLLTAELPPRTPPVLADVDRLIQVLLNLLSNALKFSPEQRGRVELALHVLGDALRIDVRDNGPGVRREDQPFVFDKFWQAGDSLVAKPPGTGLGLHISRQIVEHFGGRMWVESAEGAGACFSFTLPLARPEAAAADRGTGIRSGARASQRADVKVAARDAPEET
jgi:Na+/proline symporter/nitrogen-specific signal transduction histidine kinase